MIACVHGACHVYLLSYTESLDFDTLLSSVLVPFACTRTPASFACLQQPVGIGIYLGESRYFLRRAMEDIA